MIGGTLRGESLILISSQHYNGYVHWELLHAEFTHCKVARAYTWCVFRISAGDYHN